MKAQFRQTARGFQLLEWADLYGKPCELQQSSLAEYTVPGASAVWLGVRDSRMHLSYGQIQWLVDQLQCWLKRGTFKEKFIDHPDWPADTLFPDLGLPEKDETERP